MSEINLDSKNGILSYSKGPGDNNPLKVKYPSPEASTIIEMAAHERHINLTKIEVALLEKKIIEF